MYPYWFRVKSGVIVNLNQADSIEVVSAESTSGKHEVWARFRNVSLVIFKSTDREECIRFVDQLLAKLMPVT